MSRVQEIHKIFTIMLRSEADNPDISPLQVATILVDNKETPIGSEYRFEVTPFGVSSNPDVHIKPIDYKKE